MTLTYERAYSALIAVDGNVKAAAMMLRNDGYSFDDKTLRAYAKQRKAAPFVPIDHPLVQADMAKLEERVMPLIGGELRSPASRRAKTTARTLVFTCAQNNTRLHEDFWQSLMHFVQHKNAELHVAQITYNKKTMSAGLSKPGTEKASDNDDLWYDDRIVPYISDQSVEITPSLIWCGELNILPTRVNPLSTLHTYTRDASGIVPHVKMAMDSIAVMHGQNPRFMFSTGAVTQRNYIQKAAGQVAEFHHVFGALVVEIEGDKWWVRQINADHEGVFYDKTTRYSPGGVSTGWNVKCMVHGDIHIGKRDDAILEPVFARGGVVDQLRPEQQFFHDIVDFTPRNHHNIKDPHFGWTKEAQVPVEQEFIEARRLLYRANRPWSTMNVVVSNHDTAIGQWLRNVVAFNDPLNARFWLECNLHVANAYAVGRKPHPFGYALNCAQHPSYRMVDEDDSVKIDDIEYGLHGHLGPNGARGSPRNLKVIGKAFTAHTHSAGIVEGVYTVGVYGKLDMGYNKGPSSWSHTFGVTYQNGKRALYTFSGNEPWRNFDYA